MKLQGASTPRPMTHDLLFDMLGELEVACTRVSVTELRENTFYASITLSVNGREVEIDSRPSDALALAVRSGAPIFAAEDVIAESAIEFEHEVEDTEEVVDKFKEFLDRVTPEDFAGGEMSSSDAGGVRCDREVQHAGDEVVEADAGRLGGQRQQRRVGQAGDRVGLEHGQLVAVGHQVDAGEARRSRASSTSPARAPARAA